MPKQKYKANTQVVQKTTNDINLEAVKENAYNAGRMQAFATDKPVERSYNGFGEGLKNSVQSATSLLMNGAPTQSKDKKTYSIRQDIELSRALADYNEYHARFLQLAQARMVGNTGPSLLTQMSYTEYKSGEAVQTVHQVASRIVAQGWMEYCKAYNIDAAGLRTWNDFVDEDLGVGLPRDGSFVWLSHTFDPSNPGALNGFGTALQQLDTIDVARNLNIPYSPETQNRVNSGIEMDKYGRRKFLYFDYTSSFQYAVGTEVVKEYRVTHKDKNGSPSEYVRIPYFDERDYKNEDALCVVYYDNDPAPLPSQSTGRPWGAVAFTTMHSDAELSKYLMVAARAGASKSIAVTKDSVGGAPAQNIMKNANGQAVGVSLSAGQVTYLSEGQKIETIDFDLSYEGTLKFTQKLLQAASAALAVPYSDLTNDYSSSTFATEHSAELRNNRLWGARREHARKSVLEPFVRFWFRRCVLHGVFKYGSIDASKTVDEGLMLSMADCLQFQFAAFDHENSLDEAKAADIRLRNGTSTMREEILRLGKDPEKLIRERIEEVNAQKEAGILIEGLNFYTGMFGSGGAPGVYVYSAAERAKEELKVRENDTLAAQDMARAKSLDTALTEVVRRLDVNHNVQQHVLAAIGSLDENIMSGGAKPDYAPLAALLAPRESIAAPTSVIRSFTATEREDGTFDLNTLKMFEQPAIIIRSAPVEMLPELVVAVEVIPVVEEIVATDPIVIEAAIVLQEVKEDATDTTNEVTEIPAPIDALESLLAEVQTIHANP